MAESRGDKQGQHNGLKVATLLYSLLFFFSIGFGYYLLTAKISPFAGAVLGVLMAVFAWFLAKIIGSSEGGIAKHIPLFILLLLISAVGIFNTLMYNLEGRHVLNETIIESQDRFRNLQSFAQNKLESEGVLARERTVRTLEEALYSEIRNPVNCGQGPEARRLIGRLQEELPGFVPLSVGRRDCSQNEKIVQDYQRRINELVARAPWNRAELRTLAADAGAARGELEVLKAEAKSGFVIGTVNRFVPSLEQFDERYKGLFDIASRNAVAPNIPQALDLDSLANLGEWSRILNMLISRIDRLSTWVYLSIAIFADWLMIYFFRLLRTSRVAPRPALSGNKVQVGW